jgi:hypothetical protein
MNKNLTVRLLILGAFLAAGLLPAGFPVQAWGQETQQPQVVKGKIYQENYPLISETDLYCSFAVQDGPLPDLKVIGAERQEEREILGDGDVVYINGGQNQGVAPDQVYIFLSKGDDIKSPRTGKNYGPLIRKLGRGRVISVEADRAVLRIEKACSPVRLGAYAVLFTEIPTVTGKTMDYVPYSAPAGEKTTGEIIYLDGELNQIGPGNWAIIDLGAEEGLQVGNQITVSMVHSKGAPTHTVGTAVVISAQPHTATIKIVKAQDAIRLGYEVTAQ